MGKLRNLGVSLVLAAAILPCITVKAASVSKDFESAATFEALTKTDEYLHPDSNYATVDIDSEEITMFLEECYNDDGTIRAKFYSYEDGIKEYHLSIAISPNFPAGEYDHTDFYSRSRSQNRERGVLKGYKFSVFLMRNYNPNTGKFGDSTYLVSGGSQFNGHDYELTVKKASKSDSHVQIEMDADSGFTPSWGNTEYTADFTLNEVSPVVEKIAELEKESKKSSTKSSSSSGKAASGSGEKSAGSSSRSSKKNDDDECPDCYGLGGCNKCLGDKTVRCPSINCSNGECIECGGEGTVNVYSPSSSSGSHIKTRKCTYCGGKGICKTCGGDGEIKCDECGGTGKCPTCGK